jgi:hypothetical protein
VPGAHALNFSSPELIALLVEAHMTGAPLVPESRPTNVAGAINVIAPPTQVAGAAP